MDLCILPNPRAITWDEFDIVASKLNEMCILTLEDLNEVYVDEYYIYISKNPELEVMEKWWVPLKKAL